jgi:hypothetical protein
MERCTAVHDDLRQCRLRKGHDGEHKASKPRGTTLRNVRVSEPLWVASRAAADARGENLSDVIRAALERYVKRHGVTPPPR